MAGQRILLKLAEPPDAPGVSGAKFAATGATIALERLFEVAPAPQPGAALAPASKHAWHVTRAAVDNAFGPGSAHPWDLAHAVLRDGLGLDPQRIVAVEPDLGQDWTMERASPAALAAAPPVDPCTPAGERDDPQYEKGGAFAWHLDDTHSGLRAARDVVGANGAAITIVHLDTGYDKAHRALPVNLAGTDLQRSFVSGDPDPNSAEDHVPTSGFMMNRGHGTGTLGILAGGDTAGLRSGLQIPRGFGPLGGAPLARVVPVRIADSVVHFWTSTVAQGIDYARQIGADVLSMSMGGLPSAAWADAVNAAYDAGVVLVTAAGNSYGGLPTSLIVYPARFNRVIAACGVMAHGHPYYGLAGPMEGCAGPGSKMKTAMAAYTPNIPWLRLGCPDVVDMSGYGTSAATPQIAAAAALWLAQHGSAYPRGWQRVEAVRDALFGAASRSAGTSADPNPYVGRGLLNAKDALARIPDPAALQRTEPDSASFAFLHLLTSAFGLTAQTPQQTDMLQLELTQLALESRAFREAVPDPEAQADKSISGPIGRRALEAILDEQRASMALQEFLSSKLGRVVAQSRPSPPPSATETKTPKDGKAIPRQVAIPRPARRRLRLFATDPGDSTRLPTAFLNLATVEVPWEKLEPGPVGEYVEVIDVDPASNAAYLPVDLEDRYILGQDGLAPSEGNPQFHQQMVYAVAMRTIRNFEIALGRPALWAEHIAPPVNGKFVPLPDGGYVQRLRIYPHALLEKNAYYSPDRKALLFGYYKDFDDDDAAAPSNGTTKPKFGNPFRGRQTIFTCLSHDIVAHETTHALLDGLHRRFQEPTNPDVLAFHEAFADIVAIFQHFTFPELLRYELSRLHGDLTQASILSDLARQFGQSLHNDRALRQAIQPDAKHGDAEAAMQQAMNYDDVKEAHQRGAVLVAAVFDAFVAIYTRRTQDLIRLATAGTGLLGAGAIHPDLVERLAQEAVDTAQRILTTAIRALDYMPPVDPTFGDYLRAIVTADADIAPDHGLGYRVAFAEAFALRGIYPDDITSVSPDGLLWQAPSGPIQSRGLNDFIQTLQLGQFTQSSRRVAFDCAKRNAARLHDWLLNNIDAAMAIQLGLDFGITNERGPLFEVHSVRTALRTTADGERRTDVVAVITQHRKVPVDPAKPDGETFTFRGGCTLLLDRDYDTPPIRYAISRPVWNDTRADCIRRFVHGPGPFGLDRRYDEQTGPPPRDEPFGILHSALERG